MWQIVRFPADTVANNMAIDWQLFNDMETGKIGPTIRLYTWSESGVSVGYLQKGDGVRRPTGGGLVYHDTSEVVYCLVAPNDPVLIPSKLTDAYLMITNVICEALQELGYSVEISKTGVALGLAKSRNNLCFAQAENFEIVQNGKKVVGSAQRRTRKTVMQQGTIKTGDLPKNNFPTHQALLITHN